MIRHVSTGQSRHRSNPRWWSCSQQWTPCSWYLEFCIQEDSARAALACAGLQVLPVLTSDVGYVSGDEIVAVDDIDVVGCSMEELTGRLIGDDGIVQSCPLACIAARFLSFGHPSYSNPFILLMLIYVAWLTNLQYQARLSS